MAKYHDSYLNLRVHGYYLLKSTVNCQAAFLHQEKNYLTLMPSSHKCWAYENYQGHKSFEQLVVASVAEVHPGSLAI